MEYKRLNLRVPMPLYEKIKAYCDSVGSPVGSGMCLLCDAQINVLKAQELHAQAQELLSSLKLIYGSQQPNGDGSDPTNLEAF